MGNLLSAADPTHSMVITIATAISVGVMLIVVSRKLGLPAIVLLLLGGVILGPQVLGIVDTNDLGDGLGVIVAMSIGLILFEGGLTLDMRGYRTAPTMIKRLLTAGVLITWWLTAIFIQLIFGVPWMLAIIAGSLVIVTGPTVIAPLLKRIRVLPQLHSILHWEGVLIDPIGVFIAILCFEWAMGEQEAVVLNLALRVLAGLGLGVTGGYALTLIVRHRLVPEDMVNVFALGFAVLVFGLAEAIRPETGLLAVTVAGFVFGLTGPAGLKQVKAFKAEVTDLLIGTLFILLASRLEIEQFQQFGWLGVLVVAIVMIVIRPISIFVCSLGVDMGWREKVFLSWIAPRGIVAASLASLIALRLEERNLFTDPKFVETFTYSVIAATILIQGLTASPVAYLLKVQRPVPTGWLIVGAHLFARRIAEFLGRHTEAQVVLVDSNNRAVREAQDSGLRAIVGDARDTTMYDRYNLQTIGNVFALTDNEDLNVRICQNWREIVGSTHVFRCNPSGSAPPGEAETGEGGAGTIVWSRLPKPSLVAGELARGEANTLVSRGTQNVFADIATLLAWTKSGRFHLVETWSSDEQREGEYAELDEAQVLYLQRRANYFLRCLRPELVAEFQAKDLPELFEQMLERVIKLYPKIPRDETVQELIDRETNFPTALGHGVALPHTYVQSLDQRVCVVARVPGGIDFNASDNLPVTLVFLLLSPQGDPEGHLATLAEIAKLVIDEEVRDQLMNWQTPHDVYRTVREAQQD